MVWLHLAYLSLFLTSAAGAVLFLGFTFRSPARFLGFAINEPSYPRSWVVAHLSMASATFALFSARMFLEGGWRDPLATVGYLLLSATLGVGLWFFARYDRLGKPLRWRLVAVHLILAVLTFTAMTAALPRFTPSGPQRLPASQRGHGNSAWKLFEQHRSELKHQRRPG